MDLNVVALSGRLTRDPETRSIPSGKTVTAFGLAVNGMVKDEVTFLDCEAWEKTGEAIARFKHKGDGIEVVGRLKQETWNDKTTGAKQSKIKVVVTQAALFPPQHKSGDDQPDESTAATSSRIQAGAKPKSSTSRFDGQNQAQGGQEPAGDELPF